MQAWMSACVGPGASLRETIQKIEEGALQIALVVAEDRKLLGTVTDGDIRRGILNKMSLEDPVEKVMNPNPTCAGPGEDRDQILATMREKLIHQIPVVDATGHLVGLEVLDELLHPALRPNSVVLMAGGMGTRLSPLTDECPKPMLDIGGRPILETILTSFVQQGFRQFYISVNHHAPAIMEHFQDGKRWGVTVQYLQEASPLGTAGALSLLPQVPEHPILVMNGDVLTNVNFAQLLDFHVKCGAKGTMCVREYAHQVPYGVIHLDGYQILEIEEKPMQKFFINAGVYVLDPEVLGLVKSEELLDMTDLFQMVMDRKLQTAVFPVREYWIDIGQHAELVRAHSEFEDEFMGRGEALRKTKGAH